MSRTTSFGLAFVISLMAASMAASAAQSQSPAPKGVDDAATKNQPRTSPVSPAEAVRAQTPMPVLSEQKLDDVRKALAVTAVAPIDDATMSFAPGLVAPASVALHDLPASAASVSPLVAGHKFFVGRIDYFIVDPASRKITLIVPKNTGL